MLKYYIYNFFNAKSKQKQQRFYSTWSYLHKRTNLNFDIIIKLGQRQHSLFIHNKTKIFQSPSSKTITRHKRKLIEANEHANAE